MKALVRSYVWWLGMDKAIEQMTKECTGCQLTQKNPDTTSLDSWEWPARPLQGLHADFAGPFHSATIGLAERFVQTFKQALRAAATKGKLLSWKLANFLLASRTTPHATTGETPAMLLMGRNIRTRLDALKPNIRERVED